MDIISVTEVMTSLCLELLIFILEYSLTCLRNPTTNHLCDTALYCLGAGRGASVISIKPMDTSWSCRMNVHKVGEQSNLNLNMGCVIYYLPELGKLFNLSNTNSFFSKRE